MVAVSSSGRARLRRAERDCPNGPVGVRSGFVLTRRRRDVAELVIDRDAIDHQAAADRVAARGRQLSAGAVDAGPSRAADCGGLAHGTRGAGGGHRNQVGRRVGAHCVRGHVPGAGEPFASSTAAIEVKSTWPLCRVRSVRVFPPFYAPPNPTWVCPTQKEMVPCGEFELAGPEVESRIPKPGSGSEQTAWAVRLQRRRSRSRPRARRPRSDRRWRWSEPAGGAPGPPVPGPHDPAPAPDDVLSGRTPGRGRLAGARVGHVAWRAAEPGQRIGRAPTARCQGRAGSTFRIPRRNPHRLSLRAMPPADHRPPVYDPRRA